MRLFRYLVRTLQNARSRNGRGFERIFRQGGFVKVDVDENIDLAKRYGIMSIPVVCVFKNGEVTAKSVGYTSKTETKDFFGKELIKKQAEHSLRLFYALNVDGLRPAKCFR